MTEKRRLIIAANWKMHGTRVLTQALLTAIKQGTSQLSTIDLIIFPPFVFLEQTQHLLQNSAIAWGAQNMASELDGAYTGEISGTMLVEFGCKYVLIGHSERRLIYGEDETIIARKMKLATEIGLRPILCVGETLAQREQKLALNIVTQQLMSAIESAGGVSILENVIIAYEPVWAIGTGLTATPEQAQAVHAALRQAVAKHDPGIAERLHILYGGSVKPANAKALLAMPDIDGGLIGAASLDAKTFLEICSLTN
jgi:triosephosphate isomerase